MSSRVCPCHSESLQTVEGAIKLVSGQNISAEEAIAQALVYVYCPIHRRWNQDELIERLRMIRVRLYSDIPLYDALDQAQTLALLAELKTEVERNWT